MTKVRFVEPRTDPSGRVVFGGVLVNGKRTTDEISLVSRPGLLPTLLVNGIPVQGEWLVEREGSDGTVKVLATSAAHGLGVTSWPSTSLI